jgi:hypothetical protein
MTANDPRVLDLTAFDRPDGRSDRANECDLHTLRLALDLQLDAMLMTLGAAAHAQSRGDDEEVGVPWRRWLVEDLELARTLAAALLEGETAAVPGLGGGFANTTVETSLENLAARYTSMEGLLIGVLARPHTGQSWRGAATDALHRCRRRLVELHEHRRVVITASSGRTAFLPGELLG